MYPYGGGGGGGGFLPGGGFGLKIAAVCRASEAKLDGKDWCSLTADANEVKTDPVNVSKNPTPNSAINDKTKPLFRPILIQQSDKHRGRINDSNQ